MHGHRWSVQHWLSSIGCRALIIRIRHRNEEAYVDYCFPFDNRSLFHDR